MSKKKASELKEMTMGRALFGFLAPIVLLIALIYGIRIPDDYLWGVHGILLGLHG